jgi:hypothetical protein
MTTSGHAYPGLEGYKASVILIAVALNSQVQSSYLESMFRLADGRKGDVLRDKLLTAVVDHLIEVDVSNLFPLIWSGIQSICVSQILFIV